MGTTLLLSFSALLMVGVLGSEPAKNLEPLVAVSIGLLVPVISLATHANLFLAAFAAGVTVATYGPGFRHEFRAVRRARQRAAEAGRDPGLRALMTPAILFGEISVSGWVFAVLAIVVARPAALLVAFIGSHLARREQLAAMRFGPKGFASVVLSILAHSSTDVVVARQFREAEQAPPVRG